MGKTSNVRKNETKSLVTSYIDKKVKEPENSEISKLNIKCTLNLHPNQKQHKFKGEECCNKGESQLVQSELNSATVPDIYKPEKKKIKFEALKISKCESSTTFDNLNKNCKDKDNSDISIVYESSQKSSADSLASKKKFKRNASYENDESPSLQSEFDCTVQKAKKRKKHSKEIETLQSESVLISDNTDDSKKKKNEFEDSGISLLYEKLVQPIQYMDSECILEKKCEIQSKENNELSSLLLLSKHDGPVDSDNLNKSRKKKKKCKRQEYSEGSIEDTTSLEPPRCESPVFEKSHKKKKKKKCKELENYEDSIKDVTTQEPPKCESPVFEKSHKKKKKKKCKELEIYEGSIEDATSLEPPRCESPFFEKSHQKKKKKYKEVENYEDSIEEATSQEPITNSLEKYFLNSQTDFKNKESYKENVIPESDCSTISEYSYQQKKRKGTFKGSENSSKKENNKNTSVSDDFGTKEKTRPTILDNIEEPLKFSIPLLHEKESLKALTKEEKNVLKSQGVEIKEGRFSSTEDAILKKNYEEFCSTFKVNDPYFLLGIGRNKKPNAEVLNFLKAKHFYARLGKNLNNRSLYSIYQRARLLFNPYRNIKTKESREGKLERVLHYHKKLGNRWVQIGALVEKTNSEVRKTIEWNHKNIKKGDWTPEEEEMLISAIHSLVKIPIVSARHSSLIPWTKVAELVPTRNASQCRLHWGEKMAWEPDAKRLPWSKAKDEELVEELISRGKIYELEIDWEDVHKVFKDFAPSHMFLRKRFKKLKTKKEFQNILKNSGLPIEGHESLKVL